MCCWQRGISPSTGKSSAMKRWRGCLRRSKPPACGADPARQPRCEQRHGLPLYRQYGGTHRNGHSPGVPGDLPGLWLEDSLLRDTASMSYVWEPAEDLWIIAIDGNTDSHSGWVDDETLSWLDKVLTQAEEEGKAVLPFSHQNLVRHNARFPFGYTFGNAMTVRELMADHGVNLNLSGHIHIQHIGEFDGLHEVTTSRSPLPRTTSAWWRSTRSGTPAIRSGNWT